MRPHSFSHRIARNSITTKSRIQKFYEYRIKWLEIENHAGHAGHAGEWVAEAAELWTAPHITPPPPSSSSQSAHKHRHQVQIAFHRQVHLFSRNRNHSPIKGYERIQWRSVQHSTRSACTALGLSFRSMRFISVSQSPRCCRQFVHSTANSLSTA